MAGEEANYPRWVRVNAVKSTLEEQLETTFSKYTRAASVKEVVTNAGKLLYIDPHVPNLIAITAGTDLTKTDAYASGKIILQDKASCFPAYLLDPRSEDGDVIDACAAPGNKTTHLAAILQQHLPEFENAPQTIYAFEKDPRRAQTLEKMTTIAGSKKITRIGFGQDFLQVDPLSDKYKDVGALLLDPSCSGSGIVGRDSLPELFLPELQSSTGKNTSSKPNKRKRKAEELNEEPANIIRDDDGNETVMRSEKDLESRLEALSSFQLILLLHAFRFPSARKITYSTCSVHVQENEQVVMKALQSDIAKERKWTILPRKEQVSGMREWPVRGLPEACGGDTEVAEGCIRSYKDDGQGVMGFFVAGFVRLGGEDPEKTESDAGPYLRGDDGKIVRDMLGMPVLKSTGAPVSLNARDDEDVVDGRDQQEEEEEEDETDDSEDDDSSSGSEVDNSRRSPRNGANSAFQLHEQDMGTRSVDEDTDDDEWQGFGD